jgi:DNA helicase-2/ATP-dependent DNA helicase PcrA
VGITRARKKLYITFAYERTLYGRTQANPPSDFVEEIPARCLDENESKGTSAIPRGRSYTLSEILSRPPELTKKEIKVISNSNDFSIGTKVNHKKWGSGLVVTVNRKQDDIELTIAFDSQGIKKLSAKYAPIEIIN